MGVKWELPDDFRKTARELMDAGHYMFQQGWVPATSGNFSARLSDGTIAITVSGRHKGRLTENDIMVIDVHGHPMMSNKRPSAETPLHTALYRRYPDVNSVLHTHSLTATLLSRNIGASLILQGYELLKAFSGITTHENTIEIPNFPNDQNIERLSTLIDSHINEHPSIHGYLISGHGLYTWGRSVDEALRHVEAFEFLFQCELHGYRR